MSNLEDQKKRIRGSSRTVRARKRGKNKSGKYALHSIVKRGVPRITELKPLEHSPFEQMTGLDEEVLSKIFENRTRAFSGKSFLFNDLNIGMLCYSAMKYQDRYSKFKTSLVEFEGIDFDMCTTEKERGGLIVYRVIKDYFSNLNQHNSNIAVNFNNLYLEHFDQENDDIDWVSTLYVSLSNHLEELTKRNDDIIGLIPFQKTFRTYGKHPRLTYSTLIDLTVVKESGVHAYIYEPNTFVNGVDNSVGISNIRMLHIIRHFREIGIKLNKITIIYVPFLSGHKLVFRDFNPSNGFLIRASERFFNSEHRMNGNPAMCRTCPNNMICTPADMFPIIPLV